MDQSIDTLKDLKISNLLNDLNRMLSSEILFDVVLLTGQEKSVIRAHKAILSSRCVYFNQLFVKNNGILQKKTFTKDSLNKDMESFNGFYEEFFFPEINSEALKIVVRFMYTTEVNVDYLNICQVYGLASEYDMDDLKTQLYRTVFELINQETIVDLMIASHSNKYCQIILNQCFSWLSSECSRFENILKSDKFVKIPSELLQKIFEQEKFSDQYLAYERINSINGGEMIDEKIIKSLKFDMMTSEQLVNIRHTNKISDSILLDALESKIKDGKLNDVIVGATCIHLEIEVKFEKKSFKNKSESPQRYNTNFGVSTPKMCSNSLRRKSMNQCKDFGGNALISFGTEKFTSESFKVHDGEWNIIIRTRGRMLYSIGLELLMTQDHDSIMFNDSWHISLENSESKNCKSFYFGKFTFQVGHESFKIIEIETSENLLGLKRKDIKNEHKNKFQFNVIVQFPQPINILRFYE